MKIPSTEERIRKARRRGGFDDSYTDKKSLKNLENVHVCQFCYQYMKPYAYNHKKGTILMSCSTDGCMGNAALEKGQWDRQFKDLHARHIDRKLTFDLKHLMYGRDPARMWSIKDRIW